MAILLSKLRTASLRQFSLGLYCRQSSHPTSRSPLSFTSPLRFHIIASNKSTVAAQTPRLTSTPSSKDKALRNSFLRPFPQLSEKPVAYWLFGSAASVFGLVVFGGLTRLTESGLSITEWRPVTGSIPPMSSEDWGSEFAKYRASPEFQMLNSSMELDEFKKIYFMEWTHRLWGRVLGLSFVLPTLYFIARRRVSARMALNLVGISSLIGFQGFIGWWMIKSGLRDDLFSQGSHPRVSQYRLAAHLGTAFACYSWMLLAALSIMRRPKLANDVAAQLKHPDVVRFRHLVTGLTGLVFLTVMSGALVAGLDAGLIYNEFPYMGNGFAPPASELWSKFYSRRDDGSDTWWRNMLENPSTVQLDHRILATTTFSAIMALFVYSRSSRMSVLLLPLRIKKNVTGIVHIALMQVTLGITTLLWFVPIPLAALHQAGSLALLSAALLLGHKLRIPKSTSTRLAQRLLSPNQKQKPQSEL